MSEAQIHTKIIEYLGHNSTNEHFQRINNQRINNQRERLLRHIN